MLALLLPFADQCCFEIVAGRRCANGIQMRFVAASVFTSPVIQLLAMVSCTTG
jgi:hypothetical protein